MRSREFNEALALLKHADRDNEDVWLTTDQARALLAALQLARNAAKRRARA